jgi:hypothetical protein
METPKGDNAGNAAYVKPRNAVTCGYLWRMLNVQRAVRFVLVIYRILMVTRSRQTSSIVGPAFYEPVSDLGRGPLGGSYLVQLISVTGHFPPAGGCCKIARSAHRATTSGLRSTWIPHLVGLPARNRILQQAPGRRRVALNGRQGVVQVISSGGADGSKHGTTTCWA